MRAIGSLVLRRRDDEEGSTRLVMNSFNAGGASRADGFAGGRRRKSSTVCFSAWSCFSISSIFFSAGDCARTDGAAKENANPAAAARELSVVRGKVRFMGGWEEAGCAQAL